MVFLTRAQYRTKCPLSNKVINKNDIMLLFSSIQFEKFKKLLHNLLSKYLNYDMIELIIKLTNYEKKIGKYGKIKYLHFGDNRTIKQKINYFSYTTSDSEQDSSSDFDYLD